MFNLLWEAGYIFLLGFWVAVLFIGTWLRFRVLAVDRYR